MENQTWTKRDVNRLQAAGMKFLFCIKKQTRKTEIWNKDVRQDLRVEKLQEKFAKVRIQWYGHVLYVDDSWVPMKA
jgi:hypothetical protein